MSELGAVSAIERNRMCKLAIQKHRHFVSDSPKIFWRQFLLYSSSVCPWKQINCGMLASLAFIHKFCRQRLLIFQNANEIGSSRWRQPPSLTLAQTIVEVKPLTFARSSCSHLAVWLLVFDDCRLMSRVSCKARGSIPLGPGGLVWFWIFFRVSIASILLFQSAKSYPRATWSYEYPRM